MCTLYVHKIFAPHSKYNKHTLSQNFLVFSQIAQHTHQLYVVIFTFSRWTFNVYMDFWSEKYNFWWCIYVGVCIVRVYYIISFYSEIENKFYYFCLNEEVYSAMHSEWNKQTNKITSHSTNNITTLSTTTTIRVTTNRKYNVTFESGYKCYLEPNEKLETENSKAINQYENGPFLL